MQVSSRVKGAYAGLAVALVVAVSVLLAQGWERSTAGPDSPTAASASTSISAQPCPDVKPSPATACWSPPPGYVTAPKTGSFSPIPVPSSSGSSSDIPARTISTELVNGPFSSAQYLINNGWWNAANGEDYDVYAGSEGPDPSQGVVVVFRRSAGDPSQTGSVSLTAFPTSGQDGSLEMISASGWIITLQAADGVQYEFDVTTQSYVQS